MEFKFHTPFLPGKKSSSGINYCPLVAQLFCIAARQRILCLEYAKTSFMTLLFFLAFSFVFCLCSFLYNDHLFFFLDFIFDVDVEHEASLHNRG